jgi:galactokinase
MAQGVSAGKDRARLAHLVQQHRAAFGVDATSACQAPGRVNLLGEHTDYSGGFCMPAALSFNTLITATPRADDILRLHSLDFKETVQIELAALTIEGRQTTPHAHWSDYCFGVAWSLQDRGITLRGADLALSGDVPLGSGLSSSASVEVAMATALLALAGVELPRPQIALACQRAENAFVGAPCGIMDQYISACGVRGNALAIDTRALTSQLAPIPADLRLVVCNSMVRHSVGGGEYGRVRMQVEEAARAIALRDPAKPQLRDASLEDLHGAQSGMSPEAFRRARHVITDSQRVLDGVACLRAGEKVRFGALMTEAHASFRDDFGASCDQCDLLVRLALTLEGCLGSRLTGGGFGGCTVSLVETLNANAFASALQQLYLDATGVTAEVFVCEIADGAGPLELP